MNNGYAVVGRQLQISCNDYEHFLIYGLAIDIII